MTLIVETGAGTPNANAYTTRGFVDAYLADRDRSAENSWSDATDDTKDAAVIEATDYIDKAHGSLFKGTPFRLDIAGRQASGTITFGVVPTAAQTVTVGQVVYRFVATLSQENDVLIGATTTETAANLAAAVNGETESAAVQNDTQPNYEAEATAEGSTTTVKAQQDGLSGNLIAFATTTTATISGSGFLAAGLDQTAQPLAFPRSGLLVDGVQVIGVPLKLKQATAEYAVRALAAVLAPDPEVSSTGALIESQREKLDVLETETSYAGGGVPQIFKPYPAADELLTDYLKPAGAVIR